MHFSVVCTVVGQFIKNNIDIGVSDINISNSEQTFEYLCKRKRVGYSIFANIHMYTLHSIHMYVHNSLGRVPTYVPVRF